MMAYDNTNRGAAFLNDKKGNDRAPDFKGNINVEGKDFWLSMWLQTQGENSKAPGERYVSFSVQPKEQYSNQQAGASFDKPSAPVDNNNTF